MIGYEVTAIVITAALYFGIWCWVVDILSAEEKDDTHNDD